MVARRGKSSQFSVVSFRFRKRVKRTRRSGRVNAGAEKRVTSDRISAIRRREGSSQYLVFCFKFRRREKRNAEGTEGPQRERRQRGGVFTREVAKRRKAAEGCFDCAARRAIRRRGRENRAAPLGMARLGDVERLCRDPTAACRKRRGTPVPSKLRAGGMTSGGWDAEKKRREAV